MHSIRRARSADARLAVVVLAVSLLAQSAAAESYTAARKAGRGLAAMTTGFLEIPGNIVKGTREEGAVYGFTMGFAKGLGGVVVRELVGVYEFVTCPFPIPAGFEPLIQPEFPWGYFDDPPARK